MAFVCQSKRQLGDNKKWEVGPGSYQIGEIKDKNKDAYAPFSSTATRRMQNSKEVRPGPGYYQLGQSIGDPTVTTYTHKHSIVIKVNSEGTMPFMSKIQRFGSEPTSPEPGPGAYLKLEAKTQNKWKRTFPKKRAYSQPKPDLSVAMKAKKLYEKRLQTEEAIRSIKENSKKNKKTAVGVMSRDKVKRFNSEPSHDVGPGKYNLQQKAKVMTRPGVHSVSFASKTVKSFLDTVMYKTSNTETLKERAEKDFKDKFPGPGSYQTNHEPYMDIDKYKNHSFGSTIQRFDAQRPSNDLPFYDVHETRYPKYKGRAAFLSETKRCLTVGSSIEQQPGPGYYEPTREYIGKVLKVQIGNFGSKIKRKTIEPRGDEYLGPGLYDTDYVHRQLDEPKPSSNFTSSVPRFSYRFRDYNFGTYDIYREDISRKMLNEKLHRDNLQKIQISKPPFQSQQPRFEHYQSVRQQPKKMSMRQKQIAFTAAQYESRLKSIEKARAQVPHNPTMGKSVRFQSRKQGPGVGDYAIRDRWLKKSYNTKFRKGQ